MCECANVCAGGYDNCCADGDSCVYGKDCDDSGKLNGDKLVVSEDGDCDCDGDGD